jgi:4-amino-4-deoxy-L-arabinose transferase
MNNFLLLGLGLIAQGLFAARFIIQLLKSEKSQKVESPALFWHVSLLASFLLILYGFIRNDIVIVGGQFVGYLIYVRNLQIKGDWKELPLPVRVLAIFLPPVLFLFLIFGINYNWEKFLANPEIEGLLLTWGTLGQVVFTSRFVVQWLYSEKMKESAFPVSFWYISITGALMIAVYAVIRQDAVLFIGQAFGMIVYSRNLYLHYQPSFEKARSLVFKFKKYRFPALMIFTAMVLLFNLGNWEVTESSEARYAQIPKEMIESGDFMHPTLMGIYHYHKPPMTYWITAVAYKLFGISSWSARIFLQIAVLVQIWLVFRLGKVLFEDDKTAFYSALIFASFPTLIISGRALTTDGFLAVFVLAAIYSWFLYLRAYKKRYLLLFYLMLGFGFLTKGPVTLIVPVVLLVFQKISQKTEFGNGRIHLLGILVFLLVGLSWFVMLYIEDRQFLDYFVFKHTIERFSSDTFKRSQPFQFYMGIVILTAFPWFLVIVSRAKNIWTSKNKVLLLLMAWVFIPLLFFSLSQSKLLLYILPVYPGIALAASAVWMGLKNKTQVTWDRIQFGFQVLVLGGLAVSPLIDSSIVLNYKFYFVLVVTASILVSFRAIKMKAVDKTMLMGYLFLMGITASSTYFFGNNSKIVNDPKNVASFIKNELPDVGSIIIYDRRMPSMAFLTDKKIISIYDGSEDLNRETQFEKDELWKTNLINLKVETDWLITKKPVNAVLMVKKNKAEADPIKEAAKRFERKKEIDGWVLFY